MILFIPSDPCAQMFLIIPLLVTALGNGASKCEFSLSIQQLRSHRL